MAQILRPISDFSYIQNNQWTTPHWSKIDEVSPDDTDYTASSGVGPGPKVSTFAVNVTAGVKPVSPDESNSFIRFRIRRLAASGTSSDQISVIIRDLGFTLFDQYFVGFETSIPIDGAFHEFEVPLYRLGPDYWSEEDLGLIDWAHLIIMVQDNVQSTGDTSGSYRVSWFELELPDGGALAPTVTSVSQSSGTTAGGTAVTITGTGFSATPTVTFGGSAATSVVFVSATSLTCVTPAHVAGAVNVVVTNPDAQAGTLTNGYTYIVPIRLTQLVVEIVYDSALLTGFVVPTSTDPTTGVVTTEDNNWNTTSSVGSGSSGSEEGNGDVVSAANQTCPTAVNITSLVPYTQDIRSSTSAGPLSNTQILANGGTDRFNALWFLFAPAFSGVYSISANSSAFDAIMSIGTGRSDELGIDYRTSAATEVTAHFTLGQTYSILVQSGTDRSADSSAVNAVLNITAESPDPDAAEAPISSCLTQQWRLHRFDTKPRLEQGA